jgi:hypothetical protein
LSFVARILAVLAIVHTTVILQYFERVLPLAYRGLREIITTTVTAQSKVKTKIRE